jgi:hypothetical protein
MGVSFSGKRRGTAAPRGINVEIPHLVETFSPAHSMFYFRATESFHDLCRNARKAGVPTVAPLPVHHNPLN